MEVEFCKWLHQHKPWIPNFTRVLIRPLSQNVKKSWLGEKVKVGPDTWYVPTNVFWDAHCQSLLHGGNGTGCNVFAHTAQLTKSGELPLVQYANQMANGAVQIQSQRAFERECDYWTRAVAAVLPGVVRQQSTPAPQPRQSKTSQSRKTLQKSNRSKKVPGLPPRLQEACPLTSGSGAEYSRLSEDDKNALYFLANPDLDPTMKKFCRLQAHLSYRENLDNIYAIPMSTFYTKKGKKPGRVIECGKWFRYDCLPLDELRGLAWRKGIVTMPRAEKMDRAQLLRAIRASKAKK